MSALAPRWATSLLALVLANLLVACASGPRPGADLAEPARTVAWWPQAGDTLLDRFQPVFVTEHAERSWNRIGTPSARRTADGGEDVYVDPDRATVYRQRIDFEAEGQAFTNLVYRIHFERSPFTWRPFNVGMGRNVGVLAVVTVDARERPLWLTTVQTCGCYHAILPTTLVPAADWPEGWDPEQLVVYGEELPGLLRLPAGGAAARFVVQLRDGNHRVMDVSVAPESSLAERYAARPAASRPVDALDALELADGGTTSFFHESGRLRGLVKGAFKPFETALFGWWIHDLHVGRDRRYGPRDRTQLFYTSLNPFHKQHSDMWDFPGFLAENGWKPGNLAPPPAELARPEGAPAGAGPTATGAKPTPTGAAASSSGAAAALAGGPS